jgi:hypothetical protein
MPGSTGEGKPTALPVNAEAIPAVLRERPQWVCWRWTWKRGSNGRPGKWDKPPLDPRTLRLADSTDPATWATFEEALAAYQRGGLDGIGFVPVDDDGEELVIVGIDLDHCRDPQTGAIEPWAEQTIREMDTYAEASPSGQGVRLFAWGKLPPKGRKRGNVEVYSSKHYLTLTGQRIGETPATVEHRQAQLLALHRRVWPEHHRAPAKPPAPAVGLDDAEVIRRAGRAKNGDLFRRLHHGNSDGYPSDSEADLAYCSLIGWWVRWDAARIDSVFRSSGRMRPKWERADYRERTLRKACEGKTGGYEPRTNGRAKRGRCRLGSGHHSGDGQAQALSAAPAETRVFALGPLVLQPGLPRRMASGRISLPVNVTRDGKIAFPFILTSAASGRKEPSRVLKQLLGDDPAAAEIDSVLTKALAQAAQQLEDRQASEGPTVQEIVADKIPEALQLVCRTTRGAWSDARGGEISRLGTQFGVLQKPPEGVPFRLSGGKNRVAILSPDLCQELLEVPDECPEDNPREPGA